MSQMKQIYSYNVTSNHAMSISLMHDPEDNFNPYFVFLNFGMGQKKQDGGRTFDFKNSGFSMKLSMIKLSEFGHALTAYAKGQSKIVGKFSLFVDSSKANFNSNNGGMQKSVSLSYFANDNEPSLSLNFKTSEMDKPAGLLLNPTTALAVADACHIIYTKSIELAINGYNTVNITNSSSYSYKSSNGSAKKSYNKDSTPVAPKGNIETSDGDEPF